MRIVLILCFMTLMESYAQDWPQLQKAQLNWMGNVSVATEVSEYRKLKSYVLRTDAPLRDNIPSSHEVKIEELPHLPNIRTRSPLFDSLFALTMQEMQQSSVNVISDYAFEDAPCECFETGEKWRYVWTRDTSYSVNLGLAALDPVRSMNSLLFKVSGYRDHLGLGEQIVQDTGSGGSWPVSTDRTIWMQGAYETLKHLPYGSPVYQQFMRRSYEAMKNTVLADRKAIFSESDGLYSGEQSFLDWREQTYPDWTAFKVIHIGMMKSLSTNVIHYMALKSLAELAEELNEPASALTFKNWAAELKVAINKNFWDGETYRSLKGTFLDPRTFKYYDLLGISLAGISGVASPERLRSALWKYPHTKVGAPVIWPQHQNIAIYHNRSIWPFVTAYALKAAKSIQDPELVASFIRSLVIGPAQNLSHMENYEFTSLRNYWWEGNLSGPIVNSRRQLWSIAGYSSMVTDVIFGKETKLGAIRFVPTIPNSIRRDLFGNQETIELNQLHYQGKKIRVVLRFPKDLHEGSREVLFAGKTPWISVSELQEENEIIIDLVKSERLSGPKMSFVAFDKHSLFAPKTPTLHQVVLSDNRPLLSFRSEDHHEVVYQIFKNGKLLTTVKDSDFKDEKHRIDQTACYSVTAIWADSKNESFPSEPSCYWPQSAIQHYPVKGAGEWGHPDQKIKLVHFSPVETGDHALQIGFSNSERTNTGITCAVKKLTVINEQTGAVVRNAVFMMPHFEFGMTDSNFVALPMVKGNTYTIVVEDFFNMSYLRHFDSYRFRGGASGAYNRFNFAEVKLLYLGEKFLEENFY